MDVVQVSVARGDRLLERGQAGEGRVAVYIRARGRVGESTDNVLGRADLRVAATQVDELIAGVGGRRGDAREQGGEVLLRKAAYAVRGLAHPATLRGGRLRPA